MAGWIGCSGGDGDDAPPSPIEQGVVLGVRTPDGQPILDVNGTIGGGSRAFPDAAGFVYYVDVSPGRIQVAVVGDGYAVGHGAPEVQPGSLSMTTVVPLPLTADPIDDFAAPYALEDDGLSVEIPGGLAEFDQLPVAGPWTLGHRRLREADRYAIPGDSLGLRNDSDIRPVVFHEMIALRGWNETGDAYFPSETKVRYTLELDPGSPLLDPEATLGVYIYSQSRTYWTRAGTPEIDPEAGTASWEGSVILGWWALAREVPEPTDRGCVQGKVVDGAGAGLEGAEVRLYQDGILGVDRRSTEAGSFCVPIDPGAGGELRIVGVSPTREALYTWSGRVTGGAVGGCGSAACADLGVITAQTWTDGDRDRTWAGPGGDCDDGNPGINPNPSLGDGTYCGDRL